MAESVKLQLKNAAKDYRDLYDETDAMRKRLDTEPDFRSDETLIDYDANVEQLRDLGKKVRELEELAAADEFFNSPARQAKANGLMLEENNSKATPGDALVNSDEYRNIVSKKREGRKSSDYNILVTADHPAPAYQKATFTEAASTLTGYERPPGIVLLGQQMPLIADLFAQGQTTQPTIRYQKEDTYTNAAAMAAENTAIAEASFDTSEVDAPVQKVGVRGRVTSEVFDDFPAVRDYVNDRLVFMARQRIDAQVYNGSGTPPAIRGILNISGIQTYALTTENRASAIHKGITLVRSTGFFEPDAIVFHPNDWQQARLETDDQNNYYGGGPFSALFGDVYWGLRAVVSSFATENTALVGAFRLGAQVFYRSGLEVEVANQNEDDFNKDLLSIRVTQRLGFPVYRPAAFCTVTGI